ncbi:MAG: M24 family metallopeptidase [Anaerolineales bacterium]
MKSELDRLMQDAGLDVLLVLGGAAHNAGMLYFTGRAKLSDGSLLLKLRGQAPLLFHHPMERDEAARTGLATRSINDYEPVKLLREAGGDTVQAAANLWSLIFDQYGVRGRVALYGKVDLGPSFSALNRLTASRNSFEFVGEPSRTSVLTQARATKDPEEVERIRKMGQVTTAVVGEVAEFLKSHQAKDGRLVDRQGEVLTIGQVKRKINLWLAMRGAENPEGMIFAVGRDAGVPHSVGLDDQLVEVGKTIIFDIFPSEAGGGYFYDFTRTWCLGYAPDEVAALYADLQEVYDSVYQQLQSGVACRDFQVMTCERFEAKGHPTVLNTPATIDGYVHGLAHGVGLDVHEGPSFSHLESNTDMLQPGSVFTFEPGLYYPERGMGVRIEDTVWARPDGGFEVLAEYPKDLVLKIPGA